MTGSIPLFFAAIKARQDFIHEFESLYAKKLAIGFNTLDFVSWNENKVSEILAYFLNPNAGHAHGDVYLKLFIYRFQLNFSYSDKGKVSVQREEATDTNRRVDIVISNQDRMQVIGIENKLYRWTPDQKDQVKDYLKYLKTFCKTPTYQLVYLAPKSKILTDYSAGTDISRLQEEGKLILINYERDIISLLEDFILNTQNDRIKCFLEDFKRKITEKYMGDTNLDARAMLSKFISETDENLKMAFAVANSLDGLLNQLESDLSDQMAAVANELQLPYDAQHNHFELPNLKNCYIKYTYETGGVFYGLVKKPAYYTAHPEKISRPDLATYFGIKFKSSAWWPLYLQYHSDIYTREDFWLDVRNGHFSNYMKDFIQRVLDIPSELIQDL